MQHCVEQDGASNPTFEAETLRTKIRYVNDYQIRQKTTNKYLSSIYGDRKVQQSNLGHYGVNPRKPCPGISPSSKQFIIILPRYLMESRQVIIEEGNTQVRMR